MAVRKAVNPNSHIKKQILSRYFLQSPSPALGNSADVRSMPRAAPSPASSTGWMAQSRRGSDSGTVFDLLGYHHGGQRLAHTDRGGALRRWQHGDLLAGRSDGHQQSARTNGV